MHSSASNRTTIFTKGMPATCTAQILSVKPPPCKTFPFEEFATSYSVHVLDSAGNDLETPRVVTLAGVQGTGAKTASLGSAELGQNVATLKFKVGPGPMHCRLWPVCSL